MELTGIESTVALVTGAAQGIGAAVAGVLAGAGAHVAAVDRNAEALATVVTKLEAEGESARGYSVDVRDSAAVDALVRRVEDELGPIDILVNAAGVLRTGRVVELSDAAVERHLLGQRGRGVPRVPGGGPADDAPPSRGDRDRGVQRRRRAAYGDGRVRRLEGRVRPVHPVSGAGARRTTASGATSSRPARPTRRCCARCSARATTRAPVIEGSPAAYRVGIPLRKLAQPRDVAEAVAFLRVRPGRPHHDARPVRRRRRRPARVTPSDRENRGEPRWP